MSIEKGNSYQENLQGQEVQEEELVSFEDNIEALKIQEQEIASRGKLTLKTPEDKKWFSSTKKWLRSAIAVGVLATPFLAGCSKVENKQPEAPKFQEVQKADESGFTDNPKDVVKKRIELIKNRIKADKSIKDQIRKASPGQKREAQKAVDEMSQPLVPQEDNPDVQRPGRNIRPGPSGRVNNPDDL